MSELINNKKGFTLIELLVAVSILVLAAAAFVPVLTFVAEGNLNNKTRLVAGNLAASVLEEIREMDYAAIGTVGGSPAGSIPQSQTRTIDGIHYKIETQITWGKATGISGVENLYAFKQIRVIVKAPGVFSGVAEEENDRIYSLAAREGESQILTGGAIRVTVRNAEDQPVENISIHVSDEPVPPIPMTSLSLQTIGGTALFGGLNVGNYKVKALLPNNVYTAPHETIDGGYIVRSGVNVVDWGVTDVSLYMDSRLSKLRVRLIDAVTGQTVIPDGKATLAWSFEDKSATLFTDKPFEPGSFVANYLPDTFFGGLWPMGEWSLKISDVYGFQNYDMDTDTRPLKDDGTEWDGRFPTPGATVSVTVRLMRHPLYSEDSEAEWNDGRVLDDVVSTYDGLLVLKPGGLIGNPGSSDVTSTTDSGAKDNEKSDRAFDGSFHNHSGWQFNTSKDKLPQYIQWNYTQEKTINKLVVYRNNSPREFSFQGYNPVTHFWEVIHNGTFVYSKDKDKDDMETFTFTECTYKTFRLAINTAEKNEIKIYEIQLYSGNDNSGVRISNPISLSQFTSAPVFYVYWSAATSANTSVKVYTAVTDNSVDTPTDDMFREITNGGIITDITKGEDISGKYLWIKEVLMTTMPGESPKLDWLQVVYHY